MRIFSAKNLSLANFLIENGCAVVKVKKNPTFKTMVLIDFEYNTNLAEVLTKWTAAKKDEREAKGIE